ncbi:MAG TPA: tetratricopeptide repeat protein [Candidatus Acidoferrales bacterium]|nr:tetratricopeptide repeat protein [Candidatus Acidoferrales bacterium]
MARRRFRRKDLKRPDEFVSRGRQVLQWVQENLRTVTYAAGGVALVLLIIAGTISMRSARLRQANDDLSRALADFRNARYAQAATQFAEVAQRWPSTAAGRIAVLYGANADLNTNDFATAETLLQSLLNATAWPPYLQQEALLSLGYALERKADYAAAAGRYAEAAGLEGPYTPMAILGEARTRQQAGDKEKARALYERFTREFPQAPETDLVAQQIESLKS